MKVSLNGISNWRFYDRLFDRKVYCKTEPNWFLRLFERPLKITMDRGPVDAAYTAELNGFELGSLEDFDDGIIFNLYTKNDLAIECQRFLATSREYSYTLSIYDDYHRVICDYRVATGTMTHIKEPSYGTGMGLKHYKKVTFDWGYKSDGHGLQMIRNPLDEARMELERSQFNLRAESMLSANLMKEREENRRGEHHTEAKPVAEISAPLPPTRDIRICKE